ncbi:hypothetical protein D0844_10225 [Bordetella avium]|nr:hypothetical protein D0844_10225 [Bordetella avium]
MSRVSLRAALRALLLLGAAAWTAAHAAPDDSPGAVYQREVARCNAGLDAGDRQACLREAAAAREAAKNQGLSNGSGDFARNRTRRCDSLPDTQRRDCLTQMNNPAVTTTRGSVSSGAILRETVIPIPAGASGSAP